jgi:hypothetical protein
MTQRRHNIGWHQRSRLGLTVAVAGVALMGVVLSPQPGAWWWTAPAAAQHAGDGAPEAVGRGSADGPAAPGGRGGGRPFREPPRLLSETEVERALVARQQALRQRFEAHEDRRSQGAPEDYAIPESPPNAHVSHRPDAAGGEFAAEGGR